MHTVFFGPQRNSPSWRWVGKDVAEHLATAFHIRYFNRVDEIERGAVVFWIKHPAAAADVPLIKERKLRVIYFPVDQYQDEADLLGGRDFIDACSLLVCHTQSMGEFFSNKPVQFVDHYNKYGVDMDRRAPNGKFLWIGGYQYFPYIYRYLHQSRLSLDVTILTDYGHPSGIAAANRLSRRLDLDMDFANVSNFSQFHLVEWSEKRQQALLLSCEGAFDYKHIEDFNQRYKPPTKVQKYLASGIPTAVNRDSASFRQMQSWGVELCDPTETDIWRSSSYRARMRECAKMLARQISIEAIGNRYLDFAHMVS
jgi:hypothetical protein